MSTKNKMMRRELLRDLGAVGATGLALSASRAAQAPGAAQGTSAAAKRPRVLALVGDRYHNPDYIRVGLTPIFRELDLPIDFTISIDEIDPDLLKNYRLFVTFGSPLNWPNGYLGPDAYPYANSLEKDWGEPVMEGAITEAQGQMIAEFVRAGNGLYAYHQSGHISLHSKKYREVMGGVYLGHPPLRPFKVKVVNPDHPITRGVQEFTVNDEQHFLTYDNDPKYVILRSENTDGLNYGRRGPSAVGGWAYEHGEGRVAYTAVGHTIYALWEPEYIKIQKNAIRWLLRMS
jgi:type 1 glutamine amidotransferase